MFSACSTNVQVWKPLDHLDLHICLNTTQKDREPLLILHQTRTSGVLRGTRENPDTTRKSVGWYATFTQYLSLMHARKNLIHAVNKRFKLQLLLDSKLVATSKMHNVSNVNRGFDQPWIYSLKSSQKSHFVVCHNNLLWFFLENNIHSKIQKLGIYYLSFWRYILYQKVARDQKSGNSLWPFLGLWKRDPEKNAYVTSK